MPGSSHQIHYFDEFALDLTRGCLLGGSGEIKLRPKAFQVLKYLVENDRRLISKNELIGAIWIGASVTDDSLVQCLKEIRHALGDDKQQIIRTVHGRGYIFDQEVTDGPSCRTIISDSEGVRVVIEDLVADGTTSMLLAAKRPGSDSESPAGATAARSFIRLMVLPFRMLRPDPDVDFLAFSIPDSVAGALSLLDSVVVRSPTGAAAYAREPLDLRRV